jgi:aminocarboxymuconate-semialdehyde decarboxylase
MSEAMREMWDVHAHVVPRALLDAIRRDPALGVGVRESPEGPRLRFGGGEELRPVFPALQEWAWQGPPEEAPDVFCYSLWPDLYGVELSPDRQPAWCELANGVLLEEVSKRPPHRALGILPLGAPQAAVRALEQLRAQGAAGVLVPSNAAGRYPDHPDWQPVWEAAEGLRMPVVMHPLHVLGEERLDRYYVRAAVGYLADTTVAAARLVLGGVLERRPRLRLMLVHGGGYLWWGLGRLAHTWRAVAEARVAAAEDPRQAVGRLWFDSLVHDPALLRFLAAAAPGRVAVGTDRPFAVGDPRPRTAVREALGEGPTAQAVLTGGRRFLGEG